MMAAPLLMQPVVFPTGPQYYFSDPRCAFPAGKIQVQTEFPYYHPGSLVNGKIFLDVSMPLACTDIQIEAKGKEKVGFVRYWTEKVRNGKDSNGHTKYRDVEKHETLNQKTEFIHKK